MASPYLIVLDTLLRELVDVKPQGVPEVVDPFAFLALKELEGRKQW